MRRGINMSAVELQQTPSLSTQRHQQSNAANYAWQPVHKNNAYSHCAIECDGRVKIYIKLWLISSINALSLV